MTTCFQGVSYKPGSLNEKTAELVALGAAVVARCGPCSHQHFEKAVRAGATADEVLEVLVLAMMVSAASTKNFAGETLAAELARAGISLAPDRSCNESNDEGVP